MPTEQERVEWWDAHIDDPEVMGEVVPPPQDVPATRRLRMSITVRLTEEESEWIRNAARLSGKTFSEVVRFAVRSQLQVMSLGGSSAQSYNSGSPVEWTSGLAATAAPVTTNSHEIMRFD